MLEMAREAMPNAPTEPPSGRPLRIAMVAPPWFELPPVGYGGIESVVADLVDQLTARGHHITLLASGQHRTRAARYIPVFDQPPSDRLGEPVPEMINAAAVAAALDGSDVDIVHDHTLAGPLLAGGRDAPTVVTMHGPVEGDLGDYYETLGESIHLVAISRAQKRLNQSLNWTGTVHNAIDVNSFPFEDRKGDYTLWLGRFCDEKGAHLAIEAARQAGLRIVLAGKCNEPDEREYFDREIAPHLGERVNYVGEADAQVKRKLLVNARSLIFPIQWEEPFGMVMIEAMACGTPVVALRRGSVPEVVVHEKTGLVMDDIDALPQALRDADAIDPATCRRHVEARFDLPVMAAGYERIYRALLEQRQSSDAAAPAGSHVAGHRTGVA